MYQERTYKHQFRMLFKVEDEFVDIMTKLEPQYKKLVREENGKRVLYLQVKKAIYRMIESALL